MRIFRRDKRLDMICLETERLMLVPIKPIETPRIALATFHWTSDKSIFEHLRMRSDGWTLRRWYRHIRSWTKDDKYILAIRVKSVNKIVGFHTAEIDKAINKATIGVIIGEESWRGKGVTREARLAIDDDLFGRLNLNRVMNTTAATNEQSLKVSRALGRTLEGVLRDDFVLSDGTLTDRLVFGTLRSDWILKKQNAKENSSP